MLQRSIILSSALLCICIAIAGCKTTQPNRFAQADANRDDKLSRDEINTYLVTGVFASRDTDHDKKMTKAEWLVGEDPGQEKVFRDRDANHDGTVTLDEALAYGRSKGTANELVRDADKDKDGALTREEIKSYFASKEGPVR